MSITNPTLKNSSDASDGAKKSLTKTQTHHGVTWIDIENPTRHALAELATEYAFHSLHVESSLLENTLPQLEKEKNYLFLLIHIPVYDTQKEKIVESPLAIFLGENYLVTTHSSDDAYMKSFFALCEQDEAQQKVYFGKSAGFLLYNILRQHLDDASILVRKTTGELDVAEDLVFDSRKSNATIIVKLRQKILRLRRTIHSLEEVTQDLSVQVHHITGENLTHHFRDINRQANWLLESVEEAQKTVEIYKDADFTASTERTNEILAILTIIFTLAIPATIYSAFYGMNVPMPGANTSSIWYFWGAYTTFYIILGISVTSAVLMYIWFKLKKWF